MYRDSQTCYLAFRLLFQARNVKFRKHGVHEARSFLSETHCFSHCTESHSLVILAVTVDCTMHTRLRLRASKKMKILSSGHYFLFIRKAFFEPWPDVLVLRRSYFHT